MMMIVVHAGSRTCSPSRVAQVWGDGENEPDPDVQEVAFGTEANTPFTKETKERCNTHHQHAQIHT